MSWHFTREAFPSALSLAWVAWSCGCSSSDPPTLADAGAAEAGSRGAAAGGGFDDDSGGSARPLPDDTWDGARPMPDVVVACGASSERCCAADKMCDDGLTCSDQFCLSCGPPPAPREGCSNLAIGATGTAQQTFAGNPLTALNDNDVCVAWGSGDYPDIAGSEAKGTWFQLDLLEPKKLDAMSFWVKQTPADAEVSLTITHSVDGEVWSAWPSDIGVSKRLYDSTPWREDFVPPITARFFKVTFVKSASFVSMRELALYSCERP